MGTVGLEVGVDVVPVVVGEPVVGLTVGEFVRAFAWDVALLAVPDGQLATICEL